MFECDENYNFNGGTITGSFKLLEKANRIRYCNQL